MASWIITKVNEELLGQGNVGEWGGNEDYIKAGKAKYKFRLLDDSDQVYFEGLSGSSSSFSPLDDYGMPGFGCTTIEYWETYGTGIGRWEVL